MSLFIARTDFFYVEKHVYNAHFTRKYDMILSTTYYKDHYKI